MWDQLVGFEQLDSSVYEIFLPFYEQKQRAQFDAETQEKVVQAELDTVPSLEVKHAHGRLELRERQLQELAGTMSELSTEEVG